MTAETITSTIEGSLAIIRLERESHLNAFTYEMIGAIRTQVLAAAADPAVSTITITGSGRAFSAGLDMQTLAGESTAHARTDDAGPARAPKSEVPRTDELPSLFGFLPNVPKPVIAAVNGVAAGGGFVLAMMCDLRFASDGATFTTAFSKRGLIAEHATAFVLPRLVGLNRSLDLLWSARKFDAAEAYRIGFVDRVVPLDELMTEVRTYADELAANVAPRSIATIKRQVYAGLSQGIAESVDEGNRWIAASLSHPDLVEGVASFVERRPPQFAELTGADTPPSPTTQVHLGDD